MTDTKYNLIFGTSLFIDSKIWPASSYSIDIETDEKDNFVGIALYPGANEVYYFTSLEPVKAILENRDIYFCGHNIKGDAKWLRKWGIDIKAEQLAGDAMLMSYVRNSTKESHGLKTLCKEYLGRTWPTYKEMVHPDAEHPKKKVTLDQQPVEVVAKYCAADAVNTWELYKYFEERLTNVERHILDNIELPLMRLLFEMELRGVKLDQGKLKELLAAYDSQLIRLQAELAMFTDGKVNVNSPVQLKPFIEGRLGHKIKDTSKATLSKIDDNFVESLLMYKRKFKLYSTYLKNFEGKETISTEYNQVRTDSKGTEIGISTSRLSSSSPNLQNIPVRGEDGYEIRDLFIPANDKLLICADYSQIEYRILAHFTQEPRLLEAFQRGKDVHEETGKMLGASRDIGKTLNFASIYGAGAKKIAQTAKVSELDAMKFLAKYWDALPRVTAWIERTKYIARRDKGIFTLQSRFIPLPGIQSTDRFERAHWERAAVNYSIQGSAAEIIKFAMIAVDKAGFKPLLSVHDELLFESADAENDVVKIRGIMETVVKLYVPLVVDVGIGKSWATAKGH